MNRRSFLHGNRSIEKEVLMLLNKISKGYLEAENHWREGGHFFLISCPDFYRKKNVRTKIPAPAP